MNLTPHRPQHHRLGGASLFEDVTTGEIGFGWIRIATFPTSSINSSDDCGSEHVPRGGVPGEKAEGLPWAPAWNDSEYDECD
jgi:hypothetical protein